MTEENKTKERSNSNLLKLWNRYFQELDSGNPRECVLNSLVELIKLEDVKALSKIKKSDIQFNVT